jgi:flavin-binding protein dodecin
MFEVAEISGSVEQGKSVRWQVALKIGFTPKD